MRLVPLNRLDDLGSLKDGLDSARVQLRQQQYGSNRIIEAPSSDWWNILRDTLKDPMLSLLSR